MKLPSGSSMTSVVADLILNSSHEVTICKIVDAIFYRVSPEFDNSADEIPLVEEQFITTARKILKFGLRSEFNDELAPRVLSQFKPFSFDFELEEGSHLGFILSITSHSVVKTGLEELGKIVMSDDQLTRCVIQLYAFSCACDMLSEFRVDVIQSVDLQNEYRKRLNMQKHGKLASFFNATVSAYMHLLLGAFGSDFINDQRSAGKVEFVKNCEVVQSIAFELQD